jgi:hypothetical protein
MLARCTFLMACAAVLGPAGLSVAHAGDSRALVKQYLDDRNARGYTITAISADYLDNTFPDIDFFEVRFQQYPVAIAPPEGLSASNLFLVQGGTVYPFVSPADLEAFFLDELAAADDEDDALDAGLSWLRLSQAFSQDGFYQFGDPQVESEITADGLKVTGIVMVTGGGQGDISVELIFDADGVLQSVDESRNVTPGMRPICQATKLLHPDPLVRQMAEQDILVMGRAAKEYLDQQRAKAQPELQKAIDRMWKRIVGESESGSVRPVVRPIGQATKLLDADPLVRRMAEQDILVMGRSAKAYLDEEWARARPELQKAIDRMWKRIVDEGR